MTKEHLENGTVCSEIKPIKSILCKVSKVRDVDEDDYDFSQSNTERNIRVNFISGCVAEIHFRDKVTKLEQPTLFYTHVEEYQFSAVSTLYRICIRRIAVSPTYSAVQNTF